MNSITITTSKGFVQARTDNIVRAEADDVYTKVYLSNDEPIMIRQTLKQFEKILSMKNVFLFRVNRKHAINPEHFYQYISIDGKGYVVLKDNTKLALARRKKHEFFLKFRV